MTVKTQSKKSEKIADWSDISPSREEWQKHLLKMRRAENEKYKDKPPVMTVSD